MYYFQFYYTIFSWLRAKQLTSNSQFSTETNTTSIPARFNRLIPSSKRYFSEYTTRLMPAWMMSLAHSMQGDAVTYIVAPLLLLLERAILVMALASAWRTYGLVMLFSSSHTFSNPEGVPLYPSETVSYTHLTLPTILRV